MARTSANSLAPALCNSSTSSATERVEWPMVKNAGMVSGWRTGSYFPRFRLFWLRSEISANVGTTGSGLDGRLGPEWRQ